MKFSDRELVKYSYMLRESVIKDLMSRDHISYGEDLFKAIFSKVKLAIESYYKKGEFEFKEFLDFGTSDSARITYKIRLKDKNSLTTIFIYDRKDSIDIESKYSSVSKEILSYLKNNHPALNKQGLDRRVNTVELVITSHLLKFIVIVTKFK
jgi:hypothetical protein